MPLRSPAPAPLLCNGFAPITQAIGFLEAPWAAVVEADREWRASIGRYPGRSLVGSFEEHLSALLPLTGPLVRHLWVATQGAWTAYFDNFRIGSDPWSPIPYLSGRMGCRGVAIMWRPQTATAYGATRFDLYGQPPVDALNYTRSVAAINDGGRWSWDAIGEVQPFEVTDAYLAKRIRDRLTPELIDRYCQALGIRPFDDQFYGGPAHLVTNGNIRVSLMEESLAEAQARMSLQIGG
jgi:hypothetical protein